MPDDQDDKNPLIPPDLFIGGEAHEPDEFSDTWLNITFEDGNGFRVPARLEDQLKAAVAEYAINERDFLVTVPTFVPGRPVHFLLSWVRLVFVTTPEMRAIDRRISKILEDEERDYS